MAAKLPSLAMTRAAADLSPGRFDAGVVVGAKPAPFPGFIEPSHPTLREHAPSGGRWVHEIKFDGYRTQAHLRNGRPAIYMARLLRSWERTSDHAPAWIELRDIAQSGSGRERAIDGEET
jgi:ATP-dependent DNA ligase